MLSFLFLFLSFYKSCTTFTNLRRPGNITEKSKYSHHFLSLAFTWLCTKSPIGCLFPPFDHERRLSLSLECSWPHHLWLCEAGPLTECAIVDVSIRWRGFWQLCLSSALNRRSLALAVGGGEQRRRWRLSVGVHGQLPSRGYSCE